MENKEYSIKELQQMLSDKKISSRDLVDFYLQRIAKHDGYLNSIADINQSAYAQADALDLERAKNGPRSMMHGIPVIVKDNILTKGSMRTTIGSFAFSSFYAPFDAFVISKLKEAGAIILAKSNLSEFAYFMSMDSMPSGFGSMNGQVKHPYNKNIDPLGSSTGSAVSVAANLGPVSIGTETNGSLMSPAQQNSVVSMKPTVGLVSRYGIVPISYLQDTAGPMSRTVKDSAILLQSMIGVDEEDVTTLANPATEVDYITACDQPVDGLKVGVIDFTNYKMNDEENSIINEAKKLLAKEGVSFVDISYQYDLPDNLIALTYQFKHDLNAFFGSLKGVTPINNLLELIRFNKQHAKRCLQYGQTHFLQAEATSGQLKEREYIDHLQRSNERINAYLELFDEYDVDVLMSTKITGYPAVGGFPSLIIPAKELFDETPRSIVFITRKWAEETLFTIGSAYEKATMHRVSPKLK